MPTIIKIHRRVIRNAGYYRTVHKIEHCLSCPPGVHASIKIIEMPKGRWGQLPSKFFIRHYPDDKRIDVKVSGDIEEAKHEALRILRDDYDLEAKFETVSQKPIVFYGHGYHNDT